MRNSNFVKLALIIALTAVGALAWAGGSTLHVIGIHDEDFPFAVSAVATGGAQQIVVASNGTTKLLPLPDGEYIGLVVNGQLVPAGQEATVALPGGGRAVVRGGWGGFQGQIKIRPAIH